MARTQGGAPGGLASPRRALPALGAVLLVLSAGLTACGDPSLDLSGSPEDEPQPPEKAIWGPVERPDGSSAFPVYAELGVDTFQVQLRWADVAQRRPADPMDPADPAYDWPEDIDTAIRAAALHGIEVAILVTTSPGWANGGRAEIHAPDDPEDFADFLRTATRRYPTVHRWIVWGEPNRADRFQPNRPNDPRGPRAYASLLEAAYRSLKDATHRNVVVGGNTFTGGDVRPPDFIRWLRLPSGRPPRLDWYGHNPYPFRPPNLRRRPLAGGRRDLSDVDTLSREVNAAYRPLDRRPRLWLSEFTVQSGKDSRYFDHHVSEREQARWLRAGYAAAETAGDVAGLGWFTLLDQPNAPGSANWGLMRSDWTPKPAFDAYASLAGRR